MADYIKYVPFKGVTKEYYSYTKQGRVTIVNSIGLKKPNQKAIIDDLRRFDWNKIKQELEREEALENLRNNSDAEDVDFNE